MVPGSIELIQFQTGHNQNLPVIWKTAFGPAHAESLELISGASGVCSDPQSHAEPPLLVYIVWGSSSRRLRPKVRYLKPQGNCARMFKGDFMHMR